MRSFISDQYFYSYYLCTGKRGKKEEKINEQISESVDKPGSVVDNHLSSKFVTKLLKQPTQTQCGPHLMSFYLALLQSGVYLANDVTIIAVRSYRTISHLLEPYLKHHSSGVIFSVALSVGSHPPGVTWHSALWSPDFPLVLKTSDCLTDS